MRLIKITKYEKALYAKALIERILQLFFLTLVQLQVTIFVISLANLLDLV